jgi:protein-S-isoprenylcysteine O-methyltransferase Ste14
MTMTEARDTAGVIAPPPLIALAVLVLGFLLDWLLPAYVLTVLLSFEARIALGVVLVGAGAALAIAGKRSFDAIGTNLNPFKPAIRLATAGVYAHVRNPMYVGLALVVAGIGVALASDWTLVMLVPAAIVLHIGVVKREERYLSAKFGDAYRHYSGTVPRYGWPPQ